MIYKEVAYIIPGYLFSPEEDQYKKVAAYFRKKNILPIPVNIEWKNKTLLESVDAFLVLDTHTLAEKKYILGFSFGAIIALIAATKIAIDTLILCSLSPYFQEDLPVIPEKYMHDLNKKQIEEFKSISNEKLVKDITAKTILLYGTKEGKFVEGRAKDTYENLSAKKEIIAIEGVAHNITGKKYQIAIEGVINSL